MKTLLNNAKDKIKLEKKNGVYVMKAEVEDKKGYMMKNDYMEIDGKGEMEIGKVTEANREVEFKNRLEEEDMVVFRRRV